MWRAGKTEGLSAVEMKPDGRDGMSLFTAFGEVIAGRRAGAVNGSRGGEWKPGQEGRIKRESFSCGVQPGFLAEAGEKRMDTGAFEPVRTMCRGTGINLVFYCDV